MRSISRDASAWILITAVLTAGLGPLGVSQAEPPQDAPGAAPPERARATLPLPAHCAQAERDLGIELLPVPPGWYPMGDPDLEASSPPHTVHLSMFWIGKTEVTNEQYQKFLAANSNHLRPRHRDNRSARFDDPHQPVQVSWTEAHRFSRRLNLDLPTEAEWEAAARGPFGSLHQAGNAMEWCRDTWDRDAYRNREERNPVVLKNEERYRVLRVLRGGSWATRDPKGRRAAFRTGFSADFSAGFRVVCRPDPDLHRHRGPDREQLFRWIDTSDGRVAFWRDIPAGKFQMGSREGEGRANEHPRHLVKILGGFRISAVEITTALFVEFDPRSRHDEAWDHPVVNVSWPEAMAFCEWLSEKYEWARGARLPTEAEWEYAARAGTETLYWSGDEESDLARVGWYAGNSRHRVRSVGQKPANAWGLYDVHGNAWEWTLSGRTGYVYAERGANFTIDPATVDPAEAEVGRGRAVRGGSFNDPVPGVRSAFRRWDNQAPLFNIGFRVLLPGLHAATGDETSGEP